MFYEHKCPMKNSTFLTPTPNCQHVPSYKVWNHKLEDTVQLLFEFNVCTTAVLTAHAITSWHPSRVWGRFSVWSLKHSKRSQECVGVCLSPSSVLRKHKSKLKNIAFGHWMTPAMMCVRLCVQITTHLRVSGPSEKIRSNNRDWDGLLLTSP